MPRNQLPDNDCVSCETFHQGVQVSHNHCDQRLCVSGDRRANNQGRVGAMFHPCVYHSEGRERKTAQHWKRL